MMDIGEGKPDGRETIEFRFEPGGPIALGDLAGSFAALDRIYGQLSGQHDKLAVASLRSGSIIAELAPVAQILSQTVPYIGHVNSLGDFYKRLINAMDAFSDLERAASTTAPVEDVQPEVASELAALLKPLAGKKDAAFSVAQIKYRSETKERKVEVEATFDAAEINRVWINADRFAEEAQQLQSKRDLISQEQNLLRGVALTLHQANKGPAKSKGSTGDKAVIEAVSDKPLPVYFPPNVAGLKEKMVKGRRNPLQYVYIVDAYVSQEGGEAKSYTILEMHDAKKVTIAKPKALEAPKKRTRKPKDSKDG
ncbi:hypothetical protein [Sphingobium herbicidovorans]|nr:hypothetical protein [Sphingobium herbicidovorans]